MNSAPSAELTAVEPLAFRHVSKQFGKITALRDVSFEIPQGRMVGLLGRNGAGKTTLLDLACGLLLPTSGEVHTLGCAAGVLDTPQLSRLGVVRQEGRFVEWMSVAQQLDFLASFYPTWDAALEKRLLEALELDPSRRIAQLSQGDQQKLSIVLGVCHHPALLLMDEPMSALDPIIRARFLDLVLERLREDGCTVVISSHLLGDVEKIVDWIVCLDQGELAISTAFDELQETYAEWTVTAAPGATLPPSFREDFICSQTTDTRQARLVVAAAELDDAAPAFAAAHNVALQTRTLSLEEIFPHLLQRRRATR